MDKAWVFPGSYLRIGGNFHLCSKHKELRQTFVRKAQKQDCTFMKSSVNNNQETCIHNSIELRIPDLINVEKFLKFSYNYFLRCLTSKTLTTPWTLIRTQLNACQVFPEFRRIRACRALHAFGLHWVLNEKRCSCHGGDQMVVLWQDASTR